MAIDFKALKKNRKSATAKLNEQIKKTKGGGKVDERFWKVSTDKSGKAQHIIRFLPDPDGNAFKRVIRYSCNGPGGYYGENSPKTFGPENQDPAADHKNYLYSLDTKESKAKGSQIKRLQRFFANIYVEKDSENPDNNGKVFLMEFGPAIFKIIDTAMNPEFENDEPIAVFDMWEGSALDLRVVGREMPDFKDPSKKKLVPNYDNAKMSPNTGPLADDEEIEKIWSQTHSLEEFVAEDKFKSYDELAAKFNQVMGLDGTIGTGESKAGDLINEEPETAPAKSEKSAEPEEVKAEDSEPLDTVDTTSDDEEDALAFFNNL